MTQTPMAEPRRGQPQTRPEAALPSFKPVALPALAAAVQAVRPRPPRRLPPASLPAILRENAELA